MSHIISSESADPPSYPFTYFLPVGEAHAYPVPTAVSTADAVTLGDSNIAAKSNAIGASNANPDQAGPIRSAIFAAVFIAIDSCTDALSHGLDVPHSYLSPTGLDSLRHVVVIQRFLLGCMGVGNKLCCGGKEIG
jgi:hypothetical protein